METLDAILDFWFGDESDDQQMIDNCGKLWFGKNPKVDAQIAQRFESLLLAGEQGHWPETTLPPARQRLAKIILFDQLPRNIYRDRPQAFAFDGLALELAEQGVAAGQDGELRYVERAFMYLPFEHSEQLADQHRSVALFRALRDEVPPQWRKGFDSFYDYALRHYEIIERFGRYPHRNQLLGRKSTAAERLFLTQPNSSF